MKLLTWNVAGRVGRLPEQAAAVVSAGADVVALQEVTRRTLPARRRRSREAGFAHRASAVDLAAAERKRPLGVLTAARSRSSACPRRTSRGPSACSAARSPASR